ITRLCFLISALFYLLQAVGAARKAALVCCHWMLPSGIIGLLCWRLLGRPFVIIEHSAGLHLLRGSPAGIRIARMLVLRARRTYVVSSDLKEKLTDIAPEAAGNVEVFPMGVDCTLYLKTTQRDRIEPEFAGLKSSGQSDENVFRERLKV